LLIDGQGRWLRLLPLILVMVTIFILSDQPGTSFHLPDIINIDKVLHGLVYTLLGLTALWALPPQFRRQRPLAASVVVVLFCLGYGLSDEFHQSFVPGRFASLGDVIADTVGGLLAAVAFWGWRHWRPPVREGRGFR